LYSVRGNANRKADISVEARAKTYSGFDRHENLIAHLGALALYTGLIVFIAFPALSNLSAGPFGSLGIDRYQNLWNLWWFKRVTLDAPADWYFTPFLYHPYGTKLYLHTLSPYHLVLSLPLSLLFGNIVAYNLTFLSAFVFSAYAMFVLARYLVAEHSPAVRTGAALVAGLIWSFNPYHWAIFRSEWTNLVSLQWFPFFVLCVLKLEKAATRRGVWLNAIGVGFFFLLTLLTDYYYAIYLTIFAGLYFGWKLLAVWFGAKSERRARFTNWLKFGLRFGGSVGAALLLFSPILWQTAAELLSGKYTELGSPGFSSHTTDPLQFLLPPAHQPIWGGDAAFWEMLGVAKLNNFGANITYIGLGLSIAGLISRRGLYFWVASAGVWFILSLGNILQLNGGNTGVGLPGNFLSRFPPFNSIRFAERYVLLIYLTFAILAAYGLAFLATKIAKRSAGWQWVLFGVLGVLFWLETAPGFVASPALLRPPAFAQAIAAPAGSAVPKAILELPITKHGPDDALRMYYQTVHQRPLVGGYTSREVRDPYRNGNSGLQTWVAVDNPPTEPDVVAPLDPAGMTELLNFYKIGYLVLYPADYDNNLEALDATRRLITLTLGAQSTPFFQDGLATVYAVPERTPQNPLLLLGSGWAERELVNKERGIYQRWLAEDASEGKFTVLLSPEASKKSYNLKIELASPDKPRKVRVEIDGVLVEEVTVSGKSDFSFKLTEKPGEHVIILRPDPADGFYIPAEAGGSPNDKRKLRFAVLNVSVGL
jgi:hypothetical protein